MESLRELYRIGYGPSSSHTMGPRAAAEAFIKEHPEATKVQAELYGSLAATGKGHLTDRAIREVFQSHSIPVDILWFPDQVKPFHPNAVTLRMVEPDELSETYYSVGGGKIVKDGEEEQSASDVYDGVFSPIARIMAIRYGKSRSRPRAMASSAIWPRSGR